MKKLAVPTPISYAPLNDQLAAGVDASPAPSVAMSIRRGLGRRNVLDLGVSERSNFIDVNALCLNAKHLFTVEGHADLAHTLLILTHSLHLSMLARIAMQAYACMSDLQA
jgi:hypothetical protein